MRRSVLLACSLLLVTATACHSRRPVLVVTPEPRLVSLEVEVYDPVTNFVWEGVGVRIREAWLEWSNQVVPNGDPAVRHLTDITGLAYFSPGDVADAQVGFIEDLFLRAQLEGYDDADEAIVQVELSAPGFPIVLVDVPVSWNDPNAFVSIPYSP